MEAAAPRHTGQADLHGGHACLQLSTSPAAPSHVPAQRGSGPGQLLPLLLVCLAFQLVQMHRGDSGRALALIQAPNSGGELPWVLKCQELLTPSPRTFREQVQKYKPLEAGAAWQAAKPSLQSGDSNQAGASSQRQPLKALMQLLEQPRAATMLRALLHCSSQPRRAGLSTDTRLRASSELLCTSQEAATPPTHRRGSGVPLETRSTHPAPRPLLKSHSGQAWTDVVTYTRGARGCL